MPAASGMPKLWSSPPTASNGEITDVAGRTAGRRAGHRLTLVMTGQLQALAPYQDLGVALPAQELDGGTLAAAFDDEREARTPKPEISHLDPAEP
jgi:hypothetical protein